MRFLFFFLLIGLSFSVTAQNDKKVDEMPRFSSCADQNLSKAELDECAQNAFIKYIYENLKYPLEAKQNKTEGKVILRFTVNEFGRIENAQIEKDLSNNCGKAALEALLSLNQMDMPFIPAKSEGKAVAAELVLPVNFAL